MNSDYHIFLENQKAFFLAKMNLKTGAPHPDVSQYSLQYDCLY